MRAGIGVGEARILRDIESMVAVGGIVDSGTQIPGIELVVGEGYPVECSEGVFEITEYRSYNTFSDAFKRKMGLPVTAWIKAASEPGQS